MSGDTPSGALGRLATLFGVGTLGILTDGQLLERFLDERKIGKRALSRNR